MSSTRVRPSQVLLLFVLLGILCLAVPTAVAEADSERQSGQCSGYYYTVRMGDTWSIIGRRVGASVSSLMAANPQAVRARDIIYVGEQLCIPAPGGGVEQGGYWYQVKQGDTWNKVARATGLTVQQLWAANPGLVNRMQWLYVGQRIWVPAASTGTMTATVTPTGQPFVTPTPTAPPPAAQPVASPTQPTPPPLPLPTATSTLVPTTTVVPLQPTEAALTGSPPAVSPVVTAAATAAATPTALALAPTTPVRPTTTPPADCPTDLAGYAEAVARHLNRAGNTAETLEAWLIACHAASAEPKAVTIAPITAPSAADVIVAVQDPAVAAFSPQGRLLVFHEGTRGYALVHEYEGQGRIEIVQAADVNADGKFDLVYSDMSCGAHTCFGTLHVDSWDGSANESWITGDPTIAGPEYRIEDVTPEGQGNEIVVHGGVINSVGAGPQRAWTETYISPDGEPYILFSQVFDPSACLYHKILDANQAFDAWALDGFDPAIEAYKAAIADKTAESCGTIKDEVVTLRDFTRFRLLVAQVAAGNATEALPIANQITNTTLRGAATTFLTSYNKNSSVIQACRDTTIYAQANAGSWQFLADWGYANPSFTAGDLCPLN